MKGLMDVSEELKSKLYDLERWEGMTQDTTQSLELRLQRIEEMAEQTANQLTVIHVRQQREPPLPLQEDSGHHGFSLHITPLHELCNHPPCEALSPPSGVR